MTTTPSQLISPKFVENSQTVQFVASGNTYLDVLTVTNVTGANVTLSMSIFPDGGSVSASNTAIADKVLAPGEEYDCGPYWGQLMADGDSLSAIAGTASALVVMASGRVIT